MGARTFHSIKTKFGVLSSVDIKEFLYGNMYKIVRSFCFIVSTFISYVLEAISRRVFRFQVVSNSDDRQVGSKNCDDSDEVKRNGGRADSVTMESISSKNCDDSDEVKRNGRRADSVTMESIPMSSTNRYEFASGKDISAFVEEPKTLSFTIHEFFEDSNTEKEKFNSLSPDESSADKGLILEEVDRDNFLVNPEKELFDGENMVGDDSANDQPNTEVSGAGETEELDKNSVTEVEKEAKTFDMEKICGNEEVFGSGRGLSNRIPWNWEEYSLTSDQEDESVSSNDDLFSSNDEVGSFRYSFLNNRSIHEGFKIPESPDFFDEIEVAYNQEAETIFESLDSDDEFIELEPHKEFSIYSEDHKKLEIDKEHAQPKYVEFEASESSSRNNEMQDLVNEEDQKSESFTSFQENKTSSNDVEVETELTYEHEDIIEQLKQELKLARTGGLPTIEEETECEETETPKIMQQLKPLKIDEKNEFKDCMDEIQKIYKSYTDRMRKLDILNFQTMHAVGLLQMKDTIQSQTRRKASVATMKALFSHPLWSCKGSAVVEPMKKVVADINRDFEAVYVGQLCLSWEVIQWHYRKAQELHNYDTQELHQYNQVAGEFQLFQVLLQRFLENEPFQGPRVQNYVKNRCVVGNLLQVPLIKDDNSKDKERREDHHESAITHQMLLEIIEESMRTFWEFLRGDKNEFSSSQAPISFQDSIDSELLLDVLSDLQKKEKKLKEITRSGNCIIKKLQRNQEEQISRTCNLFLAQVDLKLISRVTNMSKLTNDQLIWCHDKLGKISISNRKVLLEPSFLLFPC